MKPSTSDDESTSLTSSGDTSSVRENRYTFKDVKAWVEKNPEKAAEIRRIFDLGEDTDAPFIALQHKRRQSREEIAQQRAESEKALKEQRDWISERVTYGETMAKQLQPLTDLWTAACPKDETGQRIMGADGQPVVDFDMRRGVRAEHGHQDRRLHPPARAAWGEQPRAREGAGSGSPGGARTRAAQGATDQRGGSKHARRCSGRAGSSKASCRPSGTEGHRGAG